MGEYKHLDSDKRGKMREKVLSRIRELSKDFKKSYNSAMSGRTYKKLKENKEKSDANAVAEAKETVDCLDNIWEYEYDCLLSVTENLSEDLRWRWTKHEKPENPGKYQVSFAGAKDVFTDRWRAKKGKWAKQKWPLWRPLCPAPELGNERV